MYGRPKNAAHETIEREAMQLAAAAAAALQHVKLSRWRWSATSSKQASVVDSSGACLSYGCTHSACGGG